MRGKERGYNIGPPGKFKKKIVNKNAIKPETRDSPCTIVLMS
jgi:hypothetical protein